MTLMAVRSISPISPKWSAWIVTLAKLGLTSRRPRFSSQAITRSSGLCSHWSGYMHTGRINLPKITTDLDHWFCEDLRLKNPLLPADPRKFSVMGESEIKTPCAWKVLDNGQTIYLNKLIVPGTGPPRWAILQKLGLTMRNTTRKSCQIGIRPGIVMKLNWEPRRYMRN